MDKHHPRESPMPPERVGIRCITRGRTEELETVAGRHGEQLERATG